MKIEIEDTKSVSKHLVLIVLLYMLISLLHYFEFVVISDTSYFISALDSHILKNTLPLNPRDAFLFPYLYVWRYLQSTFALNILTVFFYGLFLYGVNIFINDLPINKNRKILVVWFIALLPQSIIFNTGFMSESMVLLGIIVYFIGLEAFLRSPGRRTFGYLMLSNIFIAYTHMGMAAVPLILQVVYLGISIFNKYRVRLLLISLCMAFLISLLDSGSCTVYARAINKTVFSGSSNMSYLHAKFADAVRWRLGHELNEPMFSVENTQSFSELYTSHIPARTNYFFKKSKEGAKGIANSIFGNYFASYLLGPYFFEVSTPADLLLYALSFLRIGMLAYLFYCYYHSLIQWGEKVNILSLGYISIVIVYAYATGNYGTAARHNLLSDWILIVICALISRHRQSEAA